MNAIHSRIDVASWCRASRSVIQKSPSGFVSWIGRSRSWDAEARCKNSRTLQPLSQIAEFHYSALEAHICFVIAAGTQAQFVIDVRECGGAVLGGYGGAHGA
jgi:hypothetical protein